MDDVHCTFCPHNGKFSGRPCHIVIALQVLARHSKIGASVCFTCHEREFRNGCFRISKQQFCTVSNDASPFLNNAGKESRNVLEGDEWDVECIAKSDESCCFNRSINVQTSSKHIRLITDDADASSIETSETDDDVFSIVRKQFKEFSIINDFLNNTHHVVRSVGIVWDKRFKFVVATIDWILSWYMWWFSIVMIWQIGENLLNKEERIILIVCNQACDTGTRGMEVCSS